MFTLGHDFQPANIHAGGLRYHGAGAIVSQLLKDSLIEAVDIRQLDSFKAGLLFARTEGIIPAPESCHAIAAAVSEALGCKERGEKKVILFNLSGHGLVDMSAYDQYISGSMSNTGDWAAMAPFPGKAGQRSKAGGYAAGLIAGMAYGANPLFGKDLLAGGVSVVPCSSSAMS